MLTVVRPQATFSLGVAELWRYRELFYFFTWRDIKVKYRQTTLGVAWAILQPLLLTVVFTFFFGTRMRESIALPYPVFAFSGLLLWNVFAGGLLGAGTSLVGNAHIIQKVYFPRLVIPISSVMVSLFDFVVALPVLGVLLVWFGCLPRTNAPIYFLAGVVLAIAGTLGAGTALAALCFKYRDFRYIVPFLIQLLLFATPIIYPISYADAEWTRRVLALNPMSGAIGLFRGMFAGGAIDPVLTVISAISAGTLLLAGLAYFRKTEAYFADLA